MIESRSLKVVALSSLKDSGPIHEIPENVSHVPTESEGLQSPGTRPGLGELAVFTLQRSGFKAIIDSVPLPRPTRDIAIFMTRLKARLMDSDDFGR